MSNDRKLYKIRENLEVGKTYGGILMLDEMKDMRGKSGVSTDYMIDEDAYKIGDWWWHSSMLDLKKPKKKTISKGDILKALAKVCKNDESTIWLLYKIPEVLMTFLIVAEKIEDVIFEEE